MMLTNYEGVRVDGDLNVSTRYIHACLFAATQARGFETRELPLANWCAYKHPFAPPIICIHVF